jgi:hypothetical protein
MIGEKSHKWMLSLHQILQHSVTMVTMLAKESWEKKIKQPPPSICFLRSARN